jgi:transcription antitermination factor NusG
MAYWCAARLQSRHEALALHCLGLAGYETYLPRLRERRVSRGRRITVTPPLFPGYCFILIQLQWHSARWSPGVSTIILDGMRPARVPDTVIAEIRSREVDGLINLPKPLSALSLRPGAQVKILGGPFRGFVATLVGLRPRARVEALLMLLGSQTRVTLSRGDVELVPALERE